MHRLSVSIPKRVLEALNPHRAAWRSIPKPVSIPKRVLEALNQAMIAAYCGERYVSIPKRVLEALNRSTFYLLLRLGCCFNP